MIKHGHKFEKGETERTLYQNLIKDFTEDNKKTFTAEFKLLGAGVLPEVVLGPKRIELADVMVGRLRDLQDMYQEVYIKNTGRMPCQFSMHIKAKCMDDADYFSFAKAPGGLEPDNRLFTGLKVVQPDSVQKFLVGPCLEGKMPSETTTVEAIVEAKIAVGEDEYNGVEIPLKVTLVKSAVCVQSRKVDRVREKFFMEVIQNLFQLQDPAAQQDVKGAKDSAETKLPLQ